MRSRTGTSDWIWVICWATGETAVNNARPVRLPPITVPSSPYVAPQVNATFFKNASATAPPISPTNPISAPAPEKLWTGSIIPRVNVPVLSVHRIWMLPVSGILFGFFARILFRIIVATFCPVMIPMINGKPSGTAATNIVSATVNALNTMYNIDASAASPIVWMFTNNKTRKIIAAHTDPILLIFSARPSNWICKVVFTASIECRVVIILAFSVSPPTRATRMTHSPLNTVVPENTLCASVYVSPEIRAARL